MKYYLIMVEDFRRGKLIASIADIQTIVNPHNPSERDFAEYLLTRFPTTRIHYEPGPFEDRSKQKNSNKKRTTVPDFSIEDDDGNVVVIVEFTTARKKNNPKVKQQKIMRSAAPDVPYIVVYREDWHALQNGNTSYDPLSQVVSKLEATKPTVVYEYPSMLSPYTPEENNSNKD